jgi:hypothetical protein
MGKHKDGPVPVTQRDVDQAIDSSLAVGDLPPDTEAMKVAHSLLGRGVRVCLARMQTVFLSNYDFVSDTYSGKIINASSAEGPTPFQDGENVTGLRRYPCTERPDYKFQFIECGADESVLINIAHKNSAARQGSPE